MRIKITMAMEKKFKPSFRSRNKEITNYQSSPWPQIKRSQTTGCPRKKSTIKFFGAGDEIPMKGYRTF